MEHSEEPGCTVDQTGEAMYRLCAELFPICRSITGNGVRETLALLRRHVPLTIHEVPTGTRVFDWVVPKEWNIDDAYVKNARGERVIDFNESNLHVINYSVPVRKKMRLEELKSHLITLPDAPEWIPYRTAYYKETWGFCLSHNRLMSLEDGEYEVVIDSSLENGHLTYGEYVLKGRSSDEVLLSAHICHPSLANDNLSGISLLVFLAKALGQTEHHYTYRFIFAPGTIGSITWLARNEHLIDRIRHGLIVSCVGDGGGPTYKRSRRGDAEIDRVVTHVLTECAPNANIEDFSPYGYDERQYCSPGFNLPVGLFERSKYGSFPEYHTSGDNLEFIKPKYLQESFAMVNQVLGTLDNNKIYINENPKCEPQLGRRGLYDAIGGDKDSAQKQLALLWVLNQSDGERSLLDIAERADMPFQKILECAHLLEQAGLISQVEV